MSDEQHFKSRESAGEEGERAAPVKVQVQKDWSEDYFPTSARPVFLGWGLVFFGVLGLCAAVYFLSPKKEDPAKLKKKLEFQERTSVEEED